VRFPTGSTRGAFICALRSRLLTPRRYETVMSEEVGEGEVGEGEVGEDEDPAWVGPLSNSSPPGSEPGRSVQPSTPRNSRDGSRRFAAEFRVPCVQRRRKVSGKVVCALDKSLMRTLPNTPSATNTLVASSPSSLKRGKNDRFEAGILAEMV
jgi:hypothetical protein